MPNKPQDFEREIDATYSVWKSEMDKEEYGYCIELGVITIKYYYKLVLGVVTAHFVLS